MWKKMLYLQNNTNPHTDDLEFCYIWLFPYFPLIVLVLKKEKKKNLIYQKKKNFLISSCIIWEFEKK